MRVLQLHTRYREPGGEDAVVKAEAEILRRRGHEVIQHGGRNPPHPLRAAGSLCLAPWNPSATAAIRRLVTEARPDVAHVHNTWYALSPAVIRALSRAGVPVVLTMHNYRVLCVNGQLFRDGQVCETCVGSHPWHGVRHQCYRGSALLSIPAAATIALHRRLGTWTEDVDVLLAITEEARQRFVEGGLPAERVRIKPNFVFDPGPRTTPASGSNTVLFVGRLSPEKGVDVLLDAWRRAAPAPLELVVLGDGPAREELELSSPGVRFEGHVPPEEVRRRMLAARALALPSVWQEPADPLVVLEALAAGLPVLASAVGGLPRLLGRTGAGWLIPPGSVTAWREALERLTDGNRVAEASRRGRAVYERCFTEARAARALESAYEAALVRRRRALG